MLADRVQFTTAATGTGAISDGAAGATFFNMAGAGLTNGGTYSYVILDPAAGAGAFETGYGVYSASSGTISRNTLTSSNSNNPINLSGSATVILAALSRDIAPRTFPGYVSGNWYNPVPFAPHVSGATGGGSLTLVPCVLPERMTIKALGSRVTVASTGNFMLGIYGHNPATGRPTGNVLASVAGLSSGTVASISGALAANVTLEPGIYWMASEPDNGSSSLMVPSIASPLAAALVGSATLSNISTSSTSVSFCVRVVNTYGAFPNLANASFSEVVVTYGGTVLLQAA